MSMEMPVQQEPRRSSRRRIPSPTPKSERKEYATATYEAEGDRIAATHTAEEGLALEKQTAYQAEGRRGKHWSNRTEQDLPSIMVQKNADEVERLGNVSENERKLAEMTLRDMESRLEEKRVADWEMDAFAKQLTDVRDSLEKLQTQLRDAPSDRAVGEGMNANYHTIERLENAIHASRMTPHDALFELRHGGVRKTEQQAEAKGNDAELDAQNLSEKIAMEYGAPPEDLIQGRGPLGKRLKFTFKNWIARLAGQETDLDRWQQAERDKQSAELAKLERLPQEKKRRATQEELHARAETAAKETADRTSAAERQVLKDREFAKEKLTQRRAADLYDEVAGQMELMASEHNNRYSFTPEEYVVTAAHYVDSIENDLKGGIKNYREALDDMNRELDFPEGYDPLHGGGKTRLTRTRVQMGDVAKSAMSAEAARMTGVAPQMKGVANPRRTLRAEPVVEKEAEPEIPVDIEEPEEEPIELSEKDIEPVEEPITAKEITRRAKKAYPKEFERREQAEKEKTERMTIERINALPDKAQEKYSALWKFVKPYADQSPEVAAAIDMKEYPDLRQSPETNYVLLVATFNEQDSQGQKEAAAKTRELIHAMASKMNLPQEYELFPPREKPLQSGKGMVREAARRGAIARSQKRFSING